MCVGVPRLAIRSKPLAIAHFLAAVNYLGRANLPGPLGLALSMKTMKNL
jgi:hypothetical protein